jgi:hypothetical protein
MSPKELALAAADGGAGGGALTQPPNGQALSFDPRGNGDEPSDAH